MHSYEMSLKIKEKRFCVAEATAFAQFTLVCSISIYASVIALEGIWLIVIVAH